MDLAFVLLRGIVADKGFTTLISAANQGHQRSSCYYVWQRGPPPKLLEEAKYNQDRDLRVSCSQKERLPVQESGCSQPEHVGKNLSREPRHNRRPTPTRQHVAGGQADSVAVTLGGRDELCLLADRTTRYKVAAAGPGGEGVNRKLTRSLTA